MASLTPGSAAAGSSGSDLANAATGPSTSVQRALTRNKSMRHHDDFRIEVLDITSVSVSLLCSQRPPPISSLGRTFAIDANGAGSSRSTAPSTEDSSHLDSRSAPSGSHSMATQGNRRNRSRRVTKLTARTRPSAAAAIAAAATGRIRRSSVEDSEDWPSDDGATAVNDDSDADSSFDNHEGNNGYASASAMAQLFETGVTVHVNGSPWSRIVIGDRGMEEIVIVIFGLLPAEDYEVELSVNEGIRDKLLGVQNGPLSSDLPAWRGDNNSNDRDSAAVEIQAAPEETAPNAAPRSERKTSASSLSSTGKVAVASKDSSDGNAPEEAARDLSVALAAAQRRYDESVALQSSLSAELRQARKEAARAEAALRSEIETVRKALERSAGPDHRSKQKLLALQESIRQAGVQAREWEEEAEAIKLECKSELAKQQEVVEAQLEEEQRRTKSLKAQTLERSKQLESDLATEKDRALHEQEAMQALKHEKFALEEDVAAKEHELMVLLDDIRRIQSSSTPSQHDVYAAYAARAMDRQAAHNNSPRQTYPYGFSPSASPSNRTDVAATNSPHLNPNKPEFVPSQNVAARWRGTSPEVPTPASPSSNGLESWLGTSPSSSRQAAPSQLGHNRLDPDIWGISAPDHPASTKGQQQIHWDPHWSRNAMQLAPHRPQYPSIAPQQSPPSGPTMGSALRAAGFASPHVRDSPSLFGGRVPNNSATVGSGQPDHFEASRSVHVGAHRSRQGSAESPADTHISTPPADGSPATSTPSVAQFSGAPITFASVARGAGAA